jgi:DNA repair protein RecO (recombination protein O)
MPLYRDEGVVLRTQKLGEADRIITLLTRSHGRVRAVGKGVRRTRSKFGARLEPFTHVDLQLYEGRSLDVVQQAETLASYGDQMSCDYGRYTSGTAMLETAERLTAEEREPALQQFLLLVGGLRTLADGSHAPGLVLDAFLLRSLAVAGYAASFDDCARCGRISDHGGHAFFNIAAGGVVCGTCRPSGSVTPVRETLVLLSALLSGDWAAADASELRHRREASGLVAAYLQWHVERGLRSMPLVERL